MKYLFADDNGKLNEIEYPALINNKITKNAIKKCIETIFNIRDKVVKVVNDLYFSDLYKVSFENKDDIFVLAKETLPTGRSGFKDEQRIQSNGLNISEKIEA